jgi:hypothetical protein
MVSLGAYAISAARVNLTFSRKAVAWENSFYACDTAAVQMLWDVDSVLAQAERRIADRVIGEALVRQPSETLAGAQERAYLEDFSENLAALAQKYQNLSLSGGVVSADIQDVSDPSKHIRVELAIVWPYTVSIKDGYARMTLKEDSRRFKILKWQQWQDIPDSADTIQIWDGNTGITQ